LQTTLHQGFELQRIFNCTAEIANEADVRGILGWQSSPRIRQLLSRQNMAVFRREGFVVEPHFHYWQGIKSVPRDCYLTGYWQSEQYFLEAAAQIRADFTFKLPLDNQYRISQTNKRSERGKFACAARRLCQHSGNHRNAWAVFARLLPAAIRHIAEQVQQPHFFVFSDDIAWVKNNLSIDFPCQYVDHNQGAESYNDMRLMSMCRHHIIANSSFSWWGAWLNPNVNKLVVAPSRWFAKQTDVRDLLPQGWIKQ